MPFQNGQEGSESRELAACPSWSLCCPHTRCSSCTEPHAVSEHTTLFLALVLPAPMCSPPSGEFWALQKAFSDSADSVPSPPPRAPRIPLNTAHQTSPWTCVVLFLGRTVNPGVRELGLLTSSVPGPTPQTDRRTGDAGRSCNVRRPDHGAARRTPCGSLPPSLQEGLTRVWPPPSGGDPQAPPALGEPGGAGGRRAGSARVSTHSVC